MQSTQRDFLWHLLTHLQWLGRVTLEQRLWYLRRKTKHRVDIDPTLRQCDSKTGVRTDLPGSRRDTASCFSHLTCQALRSSRLESREDLCYLCLISFHFSYFISLTSWLDIWRTKLLWKVIRRSQDTILNTPAITFSRTTPTHHTHFMAL